ncbi:MAG: ABC transporter ATP-binding protein [Thermodesulfobacteriota bacterium]
MSRDGLLTVEGLIVQFGGLKAVDAVDFSIGRNEIVSLIGPNGAGKTTTFNAITGFVRKNAGSIIFDGHRLEQLRPYQIAERGVVRTFQITSLFPNLTVLENIRTGRHMWEKVSLLGTIFNTKTKRAVEEENLVKVQNILEFVDMAAFQHVVASNLPYGQQRLLEIGVALAAEPRLLLLDEPSAGLNDAETQVMMELIKKMRDQGITILLVEHDMKLVMGISDRIVVLNFGRKIAEGSPDEISCDAKVITAYLGERR